MREPGFVGAFDWSRSSGQRRLYRFPPRPQVRSTMKTIATKPVRIIPLALLLALASATAGAALQEQPAADIADAMSEPAVIQAPDDAAVVDDAMAEGDSDDAASAANDGAAEESAESSESSAANSAMAAWEAAGAVGDAHTRLAGFVGDWEARVTTWSQGVSEPVVSQGSATTQAIYDGRFVEMTFTGDFAGKPFQGTWVLGFDNVRQRYTGVWFDSMSTGLYTTMGEFHEASSTYSLRGTVADPTHAGELTPVRQEIRMVADDEHVFTSWETTHGGEERKTMEIVYTRK